jgi:superfamily I DNA/RNA helicase
MSQAIYGFRGANNELLTSVFDKVYRSTAVTRQLVDNYRTKAPILAVADMVRQHGQR